MRSFSADSNKGEGSGGDTERQYKGQGEEYTRFRKLPGPTSFPAQKVPQEHPP